MVDEFLESSHSSNRNVKMVVEFTQKYTNSGTIWTKCTWFFEIIIDLVVKSPLSYMFSRFRDWLHLYENLDNCSNCSQIPPCVDIAAIGYKLIQCIVSCPLMQIEFAKIVEAGDHTIDSCNTIFTLAYIDKMLCLGNNKEKKKASFE